MARALPAYGRHVPRLRHAPYPTAPMARSRTAPDGATCSSWPPSSLLAIWRTGSYAGGGSAEAYGRKKLRRIPRSCLPRPSGSARRRPRSPTTARSPSLRQPLLRRERTPRRRTQGRMGTKRSRRRRPNTRTPGPAAARSWRTRAAGAASTPHAAPQPAKTQPTLGSAAATRTCARSTPRDGPTHH